MNQKFLLLLCFSCTPVFGANIRATNTTPTQRFFNLEDRDGRTMKSVALDPESSLEITTAGSAFLACLDTATGRTTRIPSPEANDQVTLTITSKGVSMKFAPIEDFATTTDPKY